MAFKVLLISAPWALFHRPSIQLATLRSYLLAEGGCTVTNQHLYLHIARKIGIGLYSRIARSGWAGDALFTSLLFPDKRRDGARLFRSELRRDGYGPVPDFDSIIDDVKTCCDAWLSSIDLETIRLAQYYSFRTDSPGLPVFLQTGSPSSGALARSPRSCPT